MTNAIIAMRNIGRNRRRSLVTILAVALSCGGLSLFGGYVAWTFRAVEMQTVGSYGHIQIYKSGYYENGGGDPAAYALDNYDGLKRKLLGDPVLGPKLRLVTGQIFFNGIINVEHSRTSSTFMGLGVVPSDDEALWQWNPYGLTPAKFLAANKGLLDGPPELADDDATGCSIGIGLGRMLKLDRPMPPSGPTGPEAGGADPQPAPQVPGDTTEVDMGFLMEQSASQPVVDGGDGRPAVELMVSPPGGGLPNVTSLHLRRLMPRATKEFDDQLVKLPLDRASELLFPGKPSHVTAVLLLLNRTAETDAVAARLAEIIEDGKLDLEFKRWHEIRPFYGQIKRMLGIIFIFVFILLAMLVAFTIYNTQSAGIMERLGELGTLRAMGLRRAALWRMLVLEGVFLGLLGGGLGVVMALAGDLLLDAVDVVYVPPGVSFHAKVEVLVWREPMVVVVAFAGSLLCSMVSAALPARRAARIPVVEALKHA